MANKIEKKIVAFKVLKPEDVKAEEPVVTAPELETVHEDLKRPEVLIGATYKIKPPTAEHALYVTINDVVLNEGTEHEIRRPYELFLNSKNMEHFQWVLAFTRLVSAVFRKGGNVTFLVEEMKAVFDPQGGYRKKGGVYMPSLVADIGYTIEKHLKAVGLIETEEMSEHTKQFLEGKRKEFEEKTGEATEGGKWPDKASLCTKCNEKALVLMDGCMTCLNCGDSKCG